MAAAAAAGRRQSEGTSPRGWLLKQGGSDLGTEGQHYERQKMNPSNEESLFKKRTASLIAY